MHQRTKKLYAAGGVSGWLLASCLGGMPALAADINVDTVGEYQACGQMVSIDVGYVGQTRPPVAAHLFTAPSIPTACMGAGWMGANCLRAVSTIPLSDTTKVQFPTNESLVGSTHQLFVGALLGSTPVRSDIKDIRFIRCTNALSGVGMNLSENRYFNNRLWVNLMMAAGQFNTQNINWVEGGRNHFATGCALRSRPDGYPADAIPIPRASCPGAEADQVVHTIIKNLDLNGRYEGGTYRVIYEGDGALEFGWDATGGRVANGIGSITVNPSESGIWMKIVRSNASNPVRNIRIVPMSYENSDYGQKPLHPRYVSLFEKFKIFRFMDLMQTNGSAIVRWDDRPKENFYTQGLERGVAIETLVKMTNQVPGVDPWFNIPHLADDNYVTQMAVYLRDHVARDRKIYIEYSNEVWNYAFAQTHYADAEGMRLRLATTSFEAGRKFTGKRSLEVFRIFDREFGADARKRLVRVIGSQHANPAVTQLVLSYPGVAQSVDAIATGPYLGHRYGDPANTASTLGMTETQILQALAQEVDSTTLPQMREHQRIIASYNNPAIRLIAYEAGPHLAGYQGAENNQQLNALFSRVNRHPDMERVVLKLLNGWNANRGGMMVYFNDAGRDGRHGNWGAVQNIWENPNNEPKYRALIGHMAGAQNTAGVE